MSGFTPHQREPKMLTSRAVLVAAAMLAFGLPAQANAGQTAYPAQFLDGQAPD